MRRSGDGGLGTWTSDDELGGGRVARGKPGAAELPEKVGEVRRVCVGVADEVAAKVAGGALTERGEELGEVGGIDLAVTVEVGTLRGSDAGGVGEGGDGRAARDEGTLEGVSVREDRLDAVALPVLERGVFRRQADEVRVGWVGGGVEA